MIPMRSPPRMSSAMLDSGRPCFHPGEHILIEPDLSRLLTMAAARGDGERVRLPAFHAFDWNGP